MRVDSGLPVPIPSPRQVRLRYREVPRRAEIRGACCARYRSGNGRQADGEPHGDRRLVIAGGWLEVAVELVSVIDVGTVLLRRPRAGMGAVRVLSRPLSRRVPTQLARGSCESRLRGAHSCACRVVSFLWPVMAGGAWRGIAMSMLVHFAAATRKVA